MGHDKWGWGRGSEHKFANKCPIPLQSLDTMSNFLFICVYYCLFVFIPDPCLSCLSRPLCRKRVFTAALSRRLAGRANIKTFPPSLSHRSMFCASHRTVVMAVAKSWKKLSAARLPNTRCFLYCLAGSQVARTSRLSRPLSPTGACFVPPIAQWSWPSRNRGRN